MATPIQMPALSPTMKEGKITKWLKKEGDKVSSGEAIAEVRDRQVEPRDRGLRRWRPAEDPRRRRARSAAVGAPIAYVGAKGEKVDGGGSAPAPKPAAPAAKPAAAAAKPAEAPAPKPAEAPAAGGGEGIAIQMPALSPTMTEGKIVKWLKKEGDSVSSGQAIAEVETDKSNLEVEAYDDGVLARIVVQEGEMAKVGAPIAFLSPKGSAKPAPKPAPEARPTPRSAPEAKPAPSAKPAPKPAPEAKPAPAAKQAAGSGGRGGRLRASPLARRMAQERGLDLSQVKGSGPLGRIVKRDIETALAQPAAPAAARKAPAAAASGERAEPRSVPVSSMRKVIAQRMAEVKPGVPHFYLSVDVEMDAALKIREEAKAVESKVSVNDIIVKASAMALRRYPKMNVSLQGDHILQFETVDVGIAVAIEEGLITPIIRDADKKGLSAISSEARELAERARKRGLKPHEYTGGSLTVSNLGMYGIDAFIAVINPPQAAILAVGSVADKVVVRDGQMVIRKVMTVTLSGDHRVIDGAIGAEYLRELKALLEHPMRLLF